MATPIYPRVFTPNLNFSSVAATLASTPTGGTLETVDGEAPSVKENLADLDSLLRWYTSGADADKAYTWTFTHAAPANEQVGAIAFLGFYSSAQTLSFLLRNASDATLATLTEVVPLLTGKPALRVAEADTPQAIRSIRYSIAQPKAKPSVVGFVVPGIIESLARTPSAQVDARQNLPRVVDPYSAPVDQGEYSRFRSLVRNVSVDNLRLLEKWAKTGGVLAELEHGDWRRGSFEVNRVSRNGTVYDADFTFVEQRL